MSPMLSTNIVMCIMPLISAPCKASCMCNAAKSPRKLVAKSVLFQKASGVKKASRAARHKDPT